MTSVQAMNEANLVAQSALRFAQGAGGPARARAVRDNFPQLDRAAWRQIAEQGWLAMLVPEAAGGLGMDAAAACAVLEAAGASLLPEPVVPAMAAASFLGGIGEPGADLLDTLLDASRVVLAVPAPMQPVFPAHLSHVADCYAGAVLLVAAEDDATGDGFEVRAIALDAPGVRVDTAACVDGSLLSTLEIDGGAWRDAPRLAAGSRARDAWSGVRDVMLLGHAAALVGVMDAALEAAVGYMKVRDQFGVPIGSFQALQHAAASAHVDVVATRALVREACRAFNTPVQARAACAAKARASAASLRVTKACVQFHGAIGFADEHDIGLYLRRAMTLAARMGGQLQQSLRWRRL